MVNKVQGTEHVRISQVNTMSLVILSISSTYSCMTLSYMKIPFGSQSSFNVSLSLVCYCLN